MTKDQWLQEVERRIAIAEGCEATMYMDTSTPAVPTIGIGFNLNRSDAPKALETAGVPADHVPAVMDGSLSLTNPQIEGLFRYSFAPIESEARAVLPEGIFDALSDARRFVICDMDYNLGQAGLEQFVDTLSLITRAQQAKNSGDGTSASHLFGQAADNMEVSLWYSQVGDRAKRDVAMMRESVWCDPAGDGTDIL